uniref:Uncharacterized protein n=1 Tax=mine drainage metagenome TaxID=410659 RepID=E6QUS3_9ZZZZ
MPGHDRPESVVTIGRNTHKRFYSVLICHKVENLARCLTPEASKYLKDGITLEQLDAQAVKMSGNTALLWR